MNGKVSALTWWTVAAGDAARALSDQFAEGHIFWAIAAQRMVATGCNVYAGKLDSNKAS